MSAIQAEIERYHQAVADLMEAFAYEDCELCGQDADAHYISPDMFGNPHAWCMTEGDEQ